MTTKILHITNNYPSDKNPIFGIFVKEQIDSLTRLGIKNDVFFINGREKGKFEYIKSIFSLRKQLKSNKYDVIHCHHSLSALVLMLSGCAKKHKTVVSFQNDPSHECQTLYRFIKKSINAIILKNKSTLIDNKSIFYLPNGVNTDFFKPIDRKDACIRLNIDPTKIYILFVSSNFVRKQKRYDIFTETLKILKKKYHLKNIIELNLVNTERYLVPYYFNAASLHLLTSDFEGSPNSVKEAMACNIPVVSTDVGNVSLLLKGISGSFVAESNNTELLAELAYQAITNNALYNSRSTLIDKNLDINSVATQLLKLYKSLWKKKYTLPVVAVC